MEPIAETPAPSFFDFSLFGWPLTGLVTLFALAVYLWLGYNVGKARKTYNVPAPAMQGPEPFLCIMRAHLNTLEQLALFLPLLWMAALSSRDEVAALIGFFWPVSRILYALGYIKEPRQRFTGFLMGIGVLGLLFLISAVQMVQSLFFFQGN